MPCHVTHVLKNFTCVTELTKPIKRTFYQSSEFPVSRLMLNCLWKMFNLFPLPDLVTLKGKVGAPSRWSTTGKTYPTLTTITIWPYLLSSSICDFNFSTQEELSFIQDVAVKTGIFFDRVYSGKAFKKTIEYVQENQIENPLFIHTGGVHSIRSVFKLAPMLKNCRGRQKWWRKVKRLIENLSSDQKFVDFLKP